MIALDKAKEYANNKSSSSVFTENHIKDYLAGYEQGVKDSHAPEMLEMLENIMHANKQGNFEYINFNEIEKLIKKSTEI